MRRALLLRGNSGRERLRDRFCFEAGAASLAPLIVGGSIQGLDLEQLDTLPCQLGDQLVEQHRANALTALGVSDRDPEDLPAPGERRSITANATTRSVSTATQPEWALRSLSTFAGTSSVK